jgi:hypothetical protein
VREISTLAAACTPEVEAFCHGALCVSYSGQCFSSEAWGGRSANRGQCAQACRLPYGLVVNGQLKVGSCDTAGGSLHVHVSTELHSAAIIKCCWQLLRCCRHFFANTTRPCSIPVALERHAQSSTCCSELLLCRLMWVCLAVVWLPVAAAGPGGSGLPAKSPGPGCCGASARHGGSWCHLLQD